MTLADILDAARSGAGGVTPDDIIALLTGSGSAYGAGPPQAGGMLGQTQQAIANRRAMLDDPTKPLPQPAPAPVAPKGIRPGFEQLPPEQWTPEESAAFRLAHGIEKPSTMQSLMRLFGGGATKK